MFVYRWAAEIMQCWGVPLLGVFSLNLTSEFIQLTIQKQWTLFVAEDKNTLKMQWQKLKEENICYAILQQKLQNV